jgi:hypothetical protein
MARRHRIAPDGVVSSVKFVRALGGKDQDSEVRKWLKETQLKGSS